MMEKTSSTRQSDTKRSAGKTIGYWWDRVGIFAVLVVLIAIMSVLADNFLTIDNGLNVARSVSINAILAAGMTMIIITGGIDLSVGSILAVAGVAGVLTFTVGVPTPPCDPVWHCCRGFLWFHQWNIGGVAGFAGIHCHARFNDIPAWYRVFATRRSAADSK